MLKEILQPGLNLVLVAPYLTSASEELGFYFLDTDFHLWFLLEYAGLTSPPIFTAKERKLLLDAKKGNVLNDIYRQLFFEKKESALLKRKIGITVLNRRVVGKNDEDPEALPTARDVKEFIRTIKPHAPRVIAIVGRPEICEQCFKPQFPHFDRKRGQQEFLIGTSSVWMLGEIRGKREATELEEVFDRLGQQLAGQ